ncbi:response regulator [Marinobacterium arenosum]|uniref:response regulator n=1 Tax=Marinobacterium arenosum TaxID=2862496 RepID=UPI001C988DEE|nr:response regulator transcription factor [Marinobacterium arenosum]MBY4678895.1 response regulator transcription factor [Marinobacterium arenosum]
MPDQIRVLLVDDHFMIRAGLQRLLESEPSIRVVAEAEDGRGAFEQYRATMPDVVVLDLIMPTGDESAGETVTPKANGGLEAIRRIRSYDDRAHILVLTGKESEPFPSHVIQAGALGFVTKRCAPGELVEAISEVHAGRQYLSHVVREQGADFEADASLTDKLTKREFQVFSLLAEGQSVAAIAEQIHLSPKTVHAHRTNIFRKLELGNNSELVHLAIRQGIVDA